MMSRQQREGRISPLEMLQPTHHPTRPSAWVFRLETFGAPQDADVFTNDVPGERRKVFSIISPRKWLLAEFLPEHLSAAATPLFLHLPLD